MAECEAAVNTHKRPENVDGYCTVVHILWGEVLSFSVKPTGRYIQQPRGFKGLMK